MGPDDLAELGYLAFGDRLGWRTPAGEALPTWHELEPKVRNGFRVMAAVIAGEGPAPLESEDESPVTLDAPPSVP